MSDNDDQQGDDFFNNPTRRISPSNAATVRLNDVPVARPAGANSPDQRTRRVRPPGHAEGGVAATGAPAEVTAEREGPEFVVGWLVVIGGPGKGTSKPLGYGMNSIGRGEGSQVRLDYGDSEISRANHCQIAYDGRHRRFYVTPGGGQNLTYVADKPVLTPVELCAGDVISLGATNLAFVPFCGANFDWGSVPDPQRVADKGA